PVGFMLVLPLLFLYLTLTTKMKDSIAKLKHYICLNKGGVRESLKLDFHSHREMLNHGRPMPEIKGMLQTTGQKITRSNTHIQSQISFEKYWILKNRVGVGRRADTKY